MLQDLTRPQLEQALAWLACPDVEPIPQALKELNQLEWLLLHQLLETLLVEKLAHPLH
jgi:hypothetical protein